MGQVKPSPSFHNHDGFMRDLSRLLNEYSIDSLCDTPDFVLARYVSDCLVSFNDAVRQRQHLAFSKDVGATFIGERSRESLELNPDGTVFGVGVGYLSPLDNGAVAKITGGFSGSVESYLLSVFSRLGECGGGKVVRDVQWEVNKCLMAGSKVSGPRDLIEKRVHNGVFAHGGGIIVANEEMLNRVHIRLEYKFIDDGMQFKVCSTSFTKYFVDVLFPQKIMHVVGNCVVVYSIVD